MTRLPPALMPLWPVAKRAHRAATRTVGVAARAVGDGGPRSVPARVSPTSRATAAAEPDHLRLHAVGPPAGPAATPSPAGRPGRLRFWDDVRVLRRPPRSVLEVEGGRLVGEAAATITPAGTLDRETSPYFGIRRPTEHPVHLRLRYPEPEHVAGTVVSLASHASARNYHSLMDALPRWGLLQELFPDVRPDRVVVGHTTRWDRQLVAMVGLDALPLVEPTAGLHLRADRLLVPAIDNQTTLAPPWVTAWLRAHLPARDVRDKPRRLYVTRGDRPNTRRYVQEDALLPHLERQGFVRVDPGHDERAGADRPLRRRRGRRRPARRRAREPDVRPARGPRARAVRAALPQPRLLGDRRHNVPDSRYRYVVAEPVDRLRSERAMQGVQDDVDLPAAVVLEELEHLLAQDADGQEAPGRTDAGQDGTEHPRSPERGTP
ncbi:MAG: glycosyltransferase family 61 protein [Aeromicrobium erythreum]